VSISGECDWRAVSSKPAGDHRRSLKMCFVCRTQPAHGLLCYYIGLHRQLLAKWVSVSNTKARSSSTRTRYYSKISETISQPTVPLAMTEACYNVRLPTRTDVEWVAAAAELIWSQFHLHGAPVMLCEVGIVWWRPCVCPRKSWTRNYW